MKVAKSSIEWTDATWNPVTGCTKISPGCKHCYAERMAKRLKAMGHQNYVNGFDLTLQPHMLELPLKWRRPSQVFVNSMSDLFHDRIPISFIARVFDVMASTPQHTYQLLTKRSKRLARMAPDLDWPANVWMGVSVESDRYSFRADHLREVPAAVRFLSVEPMLGPVPSLDLNGIDWVIVGGESGPGARPIQQEWVRDLRDKCQKRGVPFFFKQWGGRTPKAGGRQLDGRTWDEMPRVSVGV